jgi:hypothetical protein
LAAEPGWTAIEAERRPAAASSAAASGRFAVGRRTLPKPLRRVDRLALGSFDAAAHTLQRQARTVILGAAAFLVPLVAMNLLGSIIAFERYTSLDDLSKSPASALFGIDAASGVESLVAYISIVTTSMVAALVGGYVTLIVTDATFGRPEGFKSPLVRTVRAMPRLIAAWLISHCWMLLVALIFISVDSSALAGLAVFGGPILLFLVAFTLVVSPTVMAEQLSPFGAVQRAVKLARKRMSASLALVIISVVIGGGLRLGISLLPRLAETTGLVTFGSLGWLVEGIAAQVAVLIVVPLVALASAHFYVQLRVHAEGLDITVAANQAFAQVSK